LNFFLFNWLFYSGKAALGNAASSTGAF